jgi:hypothetical protein
MLKMSAIPTDSVFPFQGLNAQSPEGIIDPRYGTRVENLISEHGHLYSRTGYQVMGSAVNGIPMALVRFVRGDGVEKLVLLTTTRQYYWSGSAWTDITYQAGGMSQDWAGDEEDQIHWIVTTGVTDGVSVGTYLIFTNGVDEPRYWDGGVGRCQPITTMSGWTFPGTFETCKTLAVTNGHLLLGNIKVDSTWYPYKVIWSSGLTLNNFLTLTSGEMTITDVKGEVQALIPLGERMVVYSENAIGSMTYVGEDTLGRIFYYETVISNTRLISGRSIVNLESFHVFMGQENFYVFDGTRQLRVLGTLVQPLYKSDLLLDERKKAWGFLDPVKNVAYFAVPGPGSTTKIYAVEIDPNGAEPPRWTTHTYALRPTCMGFYSLDETLCWNSPRLAGVTWDKLATLKWNDGAGLKGFPVPLLGLANGTVGQLGLLSVDGSTPVTSTWDSIDFTVPELYQSVAARFLELEVEARGGTLLVYVSTDRGANWELVGLLTLKSKMEKYKCWFDKVGKYVRIRLESTTGFEFDWLRVWFTPGGLT